MELKKIMDEICETRPPVSFVSGMNLKSYLDCYLRYNCCAHVIPKAGHLRLKFPNKESRIRHLVTNPENMVLITPMEHHLIDHGTEDARKKYEKVWNCDFSKFYDLKESLITKIQKLIEEENA